MTKLKELLNKQKDAIIVHCATENDANRLLEYLNNKGYKWISGNKLTDFNNYEDYATATCYYVDTDKTVEYDLISQVTKLLDNITIFEFSDLDLSDEDESKSSGLSSEEVLQIIAEICNAHSMHTTNCHDNCPFISDIATDCITWRATHLPETIEICKQWKAEHVAKPEPKVETRNIVRIMEKENGQLRIVYETDIPNDKNETEFATTVLTNYCKNHTGTFEAHVEHILTISSNN